MQLYKYTNYCKNILAKEKLTIPSTLIFFVTSKCNLRCKHCFYWSNLNKKEDLNLEQIQKLCRQLKGLYRVCFSGGEPFLREDLLSICQAFDTIANAKQLGIPTNGTQPDKIYEVSEDILNKCGFKNVNLNISLDGMDAEHDFIRGKGSFKQVIQTYDLLKRLKIKYKNFGMSVSTTVTASNIGSLSELARFVCNDMPYIDRHNVALLRGAALSKDVKLPQTEKIEVLFKEVLFLWRKKLGFREWLTKRLLYNTQLKILRQGKPNIFCQAGKLCGVIYDNGDVCFCEFDKPIGNIKEDVFTNIWNLKIANQRRASIKCNKCVCTHESFLEPSVIYNPFYAVKILRGF